MEAETPLQNRFFERNVQGELNKMIKERVQGTGSEEGESGLRFQESGSERIKDLLYIQ